MNRYYVSVDVGVTIDADNAKEAEGEAYEFIGKYGLEDFDDYTVIGSPKLVTENIDAICFGCNRMSVGGSNDELCPKCFDEWNKDYAKRHPEQ